MSFVVTRRTREIGIRFALGAIPQGTLDMLILQILALEPAHGYGIAQRLEQISRSVVQVNQGSLYPALHRLQQIGKREEGIDTSTFDTSAYSQIDLRSRYGSSRPVETEPLWSLYGHARHCSFSRITRGSSIAIFVEGLPRTQPSRTVASHPSRCRPFTLGVYRGDGRIVGHSENGGTSELARAIRHFWRYIPVH
jgi:hypothetical protein